MANTFKSFLAADVETTGNTVYTCPSSTQTTVIGLTIANKSNGTVTANAYLTRSGADYMIIANAPILTGSSLIAVGGDQKVVMQDGDELNVTTSANSSVDVIASLLEIA